MRRHKFVLFSGSVLFLCFVSNIKTTAFVTRLHEHSEKNARLSADLLTSHIPHQHRSTTKPKIHSDGEYTSLRLPTKTPNLTDDDADNDDMWGGFLRTFIEGKPNGPKPKETNPLRLHCGKQVPQYGPMLSHRIINGKEARPHSWPWQVFIQNTKSGNLCGGSIIPVPFNERESDVVLTAAHCIKKHKKVYHDVTVVAGLHNINMQHGPEVQCRKSFKAVPDRTYSDRRGPGKYISDIALLFMEEPFQFTDTVQPICLPNINEVVPVGESCIVNGWGINNISEGKPMSKLQQLHLTVLPESTCEDRFGDIWAHGDMICAQGQNGQTCQGDSGGPVQCMGKDGRWTVQGVVSVGGTCGDFSDPGIYSKTATYQDSIMGKIIEFSRVWKAYGINDSKKFISVDHNNNKNGDEKGLSLEHLPINIPMTPANPQQNQSNSCIRRHCRNSGVYGKALCNVIRDNDPSRCKTDGCFARVHCCLSCAPQLGATLYKEDDDYEDRYVWYKADDRAFLTVPKCEDSSECYEEDPEKNLPDTSSTKIPKQCESSGKDGKCVEWSCRNAKADFECVMLVKFDVTDCKKDAGFARVLCCRSCADALGAKSLDPHDPVILSLPCEDNSECKIDKSGDLSLCTDYNYQRNCTKTCGLCG